MTPAPPTREHLVRLVRNHVNFELYEDSAGEPKAIAIYILSDPRNLRDAVYVGQTRRPRARFLQHLSTAHLWLPDETPWWVRSPRLRPLYRWIRELYRQDQRLPTMVVHEWVDSPLQARAAERALIHECLGRDLPMFNIEGERLAGRTPLL